jgi:hypothetical protein
VPLPRGIVLEVKRLVADLGLTVTLTASNGTGPRLTGTDGKTYDVLAERLADQNPARWPDFAITLDPTMRFANPLTSGRELYQTTGNQRVTIHLGWSGGSQVERNGGRLGQTAGGAA